jgi:hypothetical protein
MDYFGFSDKNITIRKIKFISSFNLWDCVDKIGV